MAKKGAARGRERARACTLQLAEKAAKLAAKQSTQKELRISPQSSTVASSLSPQLTDSAPGSNKVACKKAMRVLGLLVEGLSQMIA